MRRVITEVRHRDRAKVLLVSNAYRVHFLQRASQHSIDTYTIQTACARNFRKCDLRPPPPRTVNLESNPACSPLRHPTDKRNIYMARCMCKLCSAHTRVVAAHSDVHALVPARRGQQGPFSLC
jgi:hypothetical protein